MSAVVILGGGVGGIVAANRLSARLAPKHRVVLVEKNAEHAFAPSFLWVMTGDRRSDQIRRPLKSLLDPRVELRLATVERIDLAARKIVTSSGAVPFDYLVIALGAELAPDSIPGLAESSETFYTAEGATRLHTKLDAFRGGRIAVAVASMPYKCPAAPHEGAMLIGDYFARRGMRDKVDIHLFTPEAQPMPVAGPDLGKAVQQLLRSKGIEFHPLHQLAKVDSGSRLLEFREQPTGSFDLLVAIPPHRAPRLLSDVGLANASGWLPVSPQTLETAHERVFAIGDVAAVPIPGRWKPDAPMMLPKAGVFAHVEAEVVADRIVDCTENREPSDTFSGHGYCMLEAGEHMAGFASGNFFAEPAPRVQIHQAGRSWHIGKVLLEKWWLAEPGWRKSMYAGVLRAGGKLYGIPIAV